MIKIVAEKVRDEAKNVRTIFFRWDQEVRAGQFIMVWLPGLGEIPMSLSYIGTPKAITVKAYGSVSQALVDMQPGQEFYIRGPYGNGFQIDPGRKLLIGGGSGMASLLPIADSETDAIISAKTKDELIFTDRFPENRIFIATDDGSAGFHGFPHELLDKLDVSVYRKIYVCGPEPMLYRVMQKLSDLNASAEFSLERTMKCGIGICDSCSVGGLQVCKQGPVFTIEQLRGNPEFGISRTTYSGKRVFLNMK
ncbi:dihydroorotate dehydrogenase electron transfer subunit [Thermoplasma sp.]|uniref:dihydroorotate dehydrogenase electron transfer subunit n=1 Tax=Thermoplasma sp. TaxID=1973142 RepID=UPI00128546CA|nr:dihydroorotate dehydrogenase electron transfer subunit [Thermoplasma sp.]KAA8922456.1 MAG: dihydroorotate dehydrogenase electron transfer subunit [Thermoplasma sp.]